MEEYIKKTDAQKCLEDLSGEYLLGNDYNTYISLPEALDRLEELDTLEVNQKEFKPVPIPVEGWAWKVRCGNIDCARLLPMDYQQFNYCPYCGCKIIKEDI